MPGNKIQVGAADGGIRVNGSGQIIMADADPCCCASPTNCQACATEDHAISITFSGISAPSWTIGGITYTWNNSSLANATYCLPNLTPCNYLATFSGGTYTANGVTCTCSLEIHLLPSTGLGTMQVSMTLTTDPQPCGPGNIYYTSVFIYAQDTPTTFVDCATTYSSSNGTLIGQVGSGGTASWSYATAC